MEIQKEKLLWENIPFKLYIYLSIYTYIYVHTYIIHVSSREVEK